MTYNSVIASEHYLASTMAAEVLRDGGNAVDASVVASLALSTLLPHLSGLGGDFFALIKRGEEIKFIDGSGPSPSELSRDELFRRGFDEMPGRGPFWSSFNFHPFPLLSWEGFRGERMKTPHPSVI